MLSSMTLVALLGSSCVRDLFRPADEAACRAPPTPGLWHAPCSELSNPSGDPASSSANTRGPACAKLSAVPPVHRTCKAKGRPGLQDPEGFCDLELDLVRKLGRLSSRAFEDVFLLDRQPEGFWALSSAEVVMPAEARRVVSGVSVVALSSDGCPLRQCLSRTRRGSGGPGIFDAAVNSDGRVVLTGWLWGEDLSFGGEPLSAPGRQRSSYVAALTAEGRHAFSTLVGGQVPATATSVAVDASGNVAVAGTYSEAFDVGPTRLPAPTYPSLFVAKYDPRGRLVWVHTSPSDSPHARPIVTFTHDGHVAVVGTYSRVLSFGTPLQKLGMRELPYCRKGSGLPSPGEHMFWIELDGAGRQVEAKAFCESFAAPLEILTSSEGDVILAGVFRGSLSFGGEPLRVPFSRGRCGCDRGCASPRSGFIVRLDSERHVVFQEALPDTSLVGVAPGPDRSTIVTQGIPTHCSQWESLPDDYRWKVTIRGRDGAKRWTREFEQLDVKAVAAAESGRLAVLVHDPASWDLFFLVYSPGI